MFGIHCRLNQRVQATAMTAGLAPAISVAAELPPAVLILDHEDLAAILWRLYRRSAPLRAGPGWLLLSMQRT
jgi:hypothetical protein